MNLFNDDNRCDVVLVPKILIVMTYIILIYLYEFNESLMMINKVKKEHNT